ncbi:ATP-binding cassette sub-family C member 3-like isoform X2 [Cherax quadricarinatus]|uniref:ATP-binding cassette sub-family C member 3-like isoform X2 n=1 Tax=Cherax quadricarinatus TaxID=27406 RepID=UPI00387E9247
MGSLGATTIHHDFFSSLCNEPFWNVSAAWNTEVPDFGRCLERTVLVWAPCALLWITSLFYLPSLNRRPKDLVPWSALSYTKVMVSVLMLVTVGVEVVWSWVERRLVLVPADYLASVALLLTQGLQVTLVVVGRKHGERNSVVLFLFWLLMVMCGLPRLYTTITYTVNGDPRVPATLIATFMVQYLCSVAMFVTNCISDVPSQLQSLSLTRNSSPMLNASLLSRLFFFWSASLIQHGWRHPLTLQDLWDVIPGYTATSAYHTWQGSLNRERGGGDDGREGGRGGSASIHSEKTKPSVNTKNMKNKGNVAITASPRTSQVSVLSGVCAIAKWPFLVSLFLHIVAETFNFLTPQLLSCLIGFITNNTEPAWHGYVYAVALLFTCELTSLFKNMYFNIALNISIKLRSALMTAVYSKALRLSGSARRESTLGQIVNLMAVDAQTVGDTFLHIYAMIMAPLTILVSLSFLWGRLGPSVLAGVVVLLLIIPINSVLVNKSKKIQAKAMSFKDKRVKMASEIVSGIKVLKLYAWETSFASMVEEVRDKEISLLKKLAFLQIINSFVFNFTPYMVALASFSTYLLVSEDNVLNAEKAFVSLALLNLMRIPIIQMPTVISQLIQASVAVTRLQKYLNASELDPMAVCSEPSMPSALKVIDGQFSWEGENGEASWSLKHVELEVQVGQLVAVVGPVGAGKSSLLSAMLGEMKKNAGRVVVNGTVAYVSQQAWLQNASLRDNIIWGQPFELKRYRQVVKACGLQPDIDMLPAGDLTEIGEKGINVSGGQKQRVALARAVYSDASIILLDDPLSAVDSHVGRHIFNCVIGPQGVLKGKVDSVLVLKEGQVVEKGTYTQLVASGGEFAQFILQYLGSMDEDEIEEELGEQLEEVSGMEHLLHQVSLRRSFGNIARENEGGRRPHTVSETDASPGSNGIPTTNTHHSQTTLSTRSRNQSNHSNYTATETNSFSTFVSNEVAPTQLYDKVSIADSTTSTLSRVTAIGEADLGAYDSLNLNSSIAKGQILVEEETAETGKISRHVYLIYGRAMGLLFVVMSFIFVALSQACNAGSNVWLSQWSSGSRISSATISNATDVSNITNNNVNFSRDIFLAGYGMFGIGQAFCLFMGLLMVMFSVLRAANVLHHNLLRNIICLPMSFFDTNPSGRIINRFSKEINVLDYILPLTLRAFVSIISTVVMTMVVIIAATPIASVFILPIMCLYCFIQHVFVATSRQLKRIESVTKSPIFSHFSESIQGASIIRAYKKQDKFFKESLKLLENSQKSLYANIAVNRWLGVHLETIGNLITFSAAILGVAGRDSISPGIVGLSVTYALNVTSQLNWLVRVVSDFEANIVSVERIDQYIQLEKEAAWQVAKKPSSSWPAEGRITFHNYETRYRPGLDLVLKGISCSFKPAEKVGIVGRTGAGKSSLTLALFRLIEAAGGYIDIDGINIAKIGLHDLRGHISIIPQDPVLFSGTLRMNLDPFGVHSDAELWKVLELAHLKQYIASQPHGLNNIVDEDGSNFSVGQRQLVCLARALLRNSRVLVLDEATAAVDLETDQLIQNTIRSQFADCTVLTIAHRLNTIMDYDRVMVLQAGTVAEFDTPAALLSQTHSIFYNMLKDAGLV